MKWWCALTGHSWSRSEVWTKLIHATTGFYTVTGYCCRRCGELGAS